MGMYGLPENVVFCRKCVISNQRPGSTVEFENSPGKTKDTIQFNSDGVCEACLVAEAKAQVSWEDRDAQLRELCDRYRSDDGSYDCVVPGSGGKDSFFAAHVLRYKYGMNPLTVTWAPNLYTDWGARNFQRWIHAGFDNQLITPSGITHRILTRLALERLFHPFQAFMIGQKAMAPRLAAQLGIPLVFYGENEAEYGNPMEGMNSAQRSWEFFSSKSDDQIFLGGTSLSELNQTYGVSKSSLRQYLPADPDFLSSQKVEVHYLGYYIRWHPQGAYYYASEKGGFEASPERTPGTYSKYNSIDDKIDDLHYWTTFIKFGIGRASYDAAQEIRSGDITREEGVALVRRYDGEYPERFEAEVFKYLTLDHPEMKIDPVAPELSQMTREYLQNLADTFRPDHLWKKDLAEGWVLRNNLE